MTWFTRLALVVFVRVFGASAVQPHHWYRADRMLKATVEENGVNPEYVSDRTYEALLTEAFDRARARSSDSVVRWKHLVTEIIAVGTAASAAIDGKAMDDKRVRDILTVHRVI